jgi:hypothetical protein
VRGGTILLHSCRIATSTTKNRPKVIRPAINQYTEGLCCERGAACLCFLEDEAMSEPKIYRAQQLISIAGACLGTTLALTITLLPIA